MLGDIIGEFKGEVTGVRVLPEEKIETSERASGTHFRSGCQLVGYFKKRQTLS